MKNIMEAAQTYRPEGIAQSYCSAKATHTLLKLQVSQGESIRTTQMMPP